MNIPALAKETMVVSLAYFVAFVVTFEIVAPIQNLFFPVFANQASLLFLPSGVRVLSAWLLGWRSTVALAPGVILSFFYLVDSSAFRPSLLIAILIAITVPAATFHASKLLWRDISPQSDQKPCWPCVMVAGTVISILGSVLTTYFSGNSSVDYFAYLIGDVFGLLFLMMGLMLGFRVLRSRGIRL